MTDVAGERLSLGDLQQLVLLAVVRLGKDAYGATIRQEIEGVAGRRVAIGTVYVTLVRLEKQGLVRSWRSAPESVRGGKAKRHFELTRRGAVALKRVREETDRMWDGMDYENDFGSPAKKGAR